jgi:integrase
MGTITYRKDRKKYVAKLEGRGAEKREFTTREKANDWVRRNEAAVENRAYIRTGVAPLFAQGTEDYLDDQRDEALQLGTISKGTLKEKIRYIKILNSLPYGKERLADIPINDLHAMGLKGCRKHLLEKLEYSPKYVREIWNCLGQAFEFWLSVNWAKTNHARLVKLPRVERNKKAWRLSMERAASIVENAPPGWRLPIKFAIITGLRTGEQRALRWKEVDLDQRVVTVNRAIDSEGEVKEAKTEAGMRPVTLTAELVAQLREWRLSQPIEQRGNDLVFPQADGRIANAGQYYLLGLKKALKAAGIEDRITWHQLRHYYASILIFQTKTPPETVSRLMGHKSFDFTMRTYGHWLNEEETDFAFSDALGAAFSFPARSPLKVVDGG